MKKLINCEVENCIPTPSSCTTWNGGEIEYLGICDGDSLNNLLVEVITKLQEITGDDLSSFDIDSLLDICNKKAPTEITILSILNLLKDNQICLKDFIDNLSEQLAELFDTQSVNVNLKCYSTFDNLGNNLSITRTQLDQLIIDNLCSNKQRIDGLEGAVISLQNQLNNIDISPIIDELDFSTCINPAILPTSSQVKNTSQALCDLRDLTGDEGDIASALAQTPGDLNLEFGLLVGWIPAPINWAEHYNNMILEMENLRQRVIFMENNCCNVTCDDVKVGFSAVYNEDADGIILKFTSGAGTNIPNGFLDIGSTITITDIDDNVETFLTSSPDLIANGAEIEISIAGLNTTGVLQVNIDSNISNGSLTCSKCLNKTVQKASCNFCTLCAEGAEGSSIVVIYESSNSAIVVENSTTTTTTVGI